ncbi:MAG: N-acetyltransferase [Methanomicrobiaceae archaeon]|nr:N-acetyltransferase [Methanomicrobiaceae archaeon]
MTGFTYQKISESDRKGVTDIFNYYIENSFAAYPEGKVPYEFFDNFLAIAAKYPSVSVRDDKGEAAGFGMLRPHSPFPSFSHTADITYFIRPDSTGKGIGKKILEILENDGRKLGISVILAGISSKNPGSINFHSKNGFTKCGVFPDIGKKHGEFFSEVWMYKKIRE